MTRIATNCVLGFNLLMKYINDLITLIHSRASAALLLDYKKSHGNEWTSFVLDEMRSTMRFGLVRKLRFAHRLTLELFVVFLLLYRRNDWILEEYLIEGNDIN